jgi:5-methylthioribose kinase
MDDTGGIAALAPDALGAYLVRRGVVEAGTPVSAVPLGGGVSNVVLAARFRGRAVVVKQSLPRLRVADEWLAKRERVLTEAAALRLMAALTPGRVPDVLDVDGETFTIVIAHAADGWWDWKARLLAGDADPAVARELGRVLGAWHRATWDDAGVARRFGDLEAFEQLRVDPYYRTLARRCPNLAGAVASRIARMEGSRRCLVHGDFSPKNVLLGPVREDGLWVVDAEVAHFGDPAFDSGFMLNHLMLKALHRPADRDRHRACALAFWDAYRGSGAGPDDTLGHLACLMLSRVHGKSPAEYLDQRGRERASGLGRSLLLRPPGSLDDAWDRLEQEVRR